VLVFVAFSLLLSLKGGARNRYDWANGMDPWTASVIEDRSEAEVIRAYGGDPDHSIGTMPFAAVMDIQLRENFHDVGIDGPAPPTQRRENGTYLYIQTIAHDRYVVVLENNGFIGTDANLARHLSQHGGRFFSVFWNVNAVTRIVQAIDGKLIADFEPLFQHSSGYGIPTWRTDGMFPMGRVQSGMVEAMTQQTGLVFEREWLDKPLPVYRTQHRY
jgi:Family of unknown function (DUF6461)